MTTFNMLNWDTPKLCPPRLPEEEKVKTKKNFIIKWNNKFYDETHSDK